MGSPICHHRKRRAGIIAGIIASTLCLVGGNVRFLFSILSSYSADQLWKQRDLGHATTPQMRGKDDAGPVNETVSVRSNGGPLGGGDTQAIKDSKETDFAKFFEQRRPHNGNENATIGNETASEDGNTTSLDDLNDDGFASCLMFMDDTHLLPEWLAYHYQVLPLRRLIVAVDPKSLTSPEAILNRYHDRGLVNVSIWHDEDYFSEKDAITKRFMGLQNKTDPEEVKVGVFRWRQRKFYKSCMDRLWEEGWNWVALIDTDEFIARNPIANENETVRVVHPTIMEMLDDPVNRNASDSLSGPCVSMTRPEYTGHWDLFTGTHKTKETLPPHTLDAIDSIEHQSNKEILAQRDLMTFRWWVKNKKIRPGKCMIDLSRIGDKPIRMGDVNVHVPIKSVCGQSKTFLKEAHSAYSVHHYTGTFEQWSFRDDGRNSRDKNMWKAIKKGRIPDLHDHPIRNWLSAFVSSVGPDLAVILLEGAGKTNSTDKV